MRFSALLMLMELASKLKENYMVLLPETIPFLAELMEGENTHTHFLEATFNLDDTIKSI